MLAPVINIIPLTTIRKERILPIPGKVVVRQGQEVSPRDPIAEANLEPEHLLLNIASGLGVSISQADSLIQCEVGDDVNEGDLIAGPVGLVRRVVRTPVTGQIALVGGGQVLIQVEKPPHKILAGIAGTVTKLIPDFGAEIETAGALVQGVWGNGKANYGLLQSKIDKPDGTLTASDLDMSLRGSIVLGGHCKDPDAIRKIKEIPLRGLLVSSMASDLIPLAEKVDAPILVLEGFGELPLNEISYNLLTTHNNREVAVNAERFNRNAGTRPEIVIPLPTSHDTGVRLMVEDFAEGQVVRVLRQPFVGKTGKIEKILPGLVTFDSGLRVPGALVDLGSDESAKIPLANLEVVG